MLPLLYLLLKRDFEIMRLARTHHLSADELRDSMCTVDQVMKAVSDRHKNLVGAFPLNYPCHFAHNTLKNCSNSRS